MSACMPIPKGIDNQWCDVDPVHDWLNFTSNLLLTKWIGMALVKQHVMDACQED